MRVKFNIKLKNGDTIICDDIQKVTFTSGFDPIGFDAIVYDNNNRFIKPEDIDTITFKEKKLIEDAPYYFNESFC